MVARCRTANSASSHSLSLATSPKVAKQSLSVIEAIRARSSTASSWSDLVHRTLAASLMVQYLTGWVEYSSTTDCSKVPTGSVTNGAGAESSVRGHPLSVGD